MKKFTLEIGLFFIPVILVIASYIIIDPYCVIHADPKQAINTVASDYLKTNRYLDTYADSNYQHFVFGNSRTIGITPAYKKVYPNAFFDFHNPGECILNIERKISLIDSENQKITSCVIILDNDLIKNVNNSSVYYQGPEYLHHPLSSELSYIQFHKKLLQYYLTDYFWFKIADYSITQTYKPYMSDCFREPGYAKTYADLDALIKKDSVNYYLSNAFSFGERKGGVSGITIAEIDKIRLITIAEILTKHQSHYKVILGPNYDQIKINPVVINTLNKIFGADNVIDFSGENLITNHMGNYYESSHYRPIVGDKLLYQGLD